MAAERPEHVLLTADTMGGVWSYAVELAGELARGGTRVTIAAMTPPAGAGTGLRRDDARRAEIAAMPGVSLQERPYALEWMREPWDDVERAGEWLLELERAERPDVVHLNQFAFGALPFQAPTLVVAHSCVCSWWQAVHGAAAPAEWARYRQAVRAGLDGADLVGAPTAAMLDALRAEHGFAGEGVVLPNGRDGRRFVPADKEPFVLSAGRLWDEAKNLAALEAVAPALPWPVYVAGPQTHPDGGERPPQHVTALGALGTDALAAWMGRAAIYALPARYEPFGLSALEAALAGCALVLGDIASLRELWAGAAVFVPPNDPDALRAAIVMLAGDDEMRRALASAARARALRFTPGAMADACLRAYARAAAARDTDAAREVVACAS